MTTNKPWLLSNGQLAERYLRESYDHEAQSNLPKASFAMARAQFFLTRQLLPTSDGESNIRFIVAPQGEVNGDPLGILLNALSHAIAPSTHAQRLSAIKQLEELLGWDSPSDRPRNAADLEDKLTKFFAETSVNPTIDTTHKMN